MTVTAKYFENKIVFKVVSKASNLFPADTSYLFHRSKSTVVFLGLWKERSATRYLIFQSLSRISVPNVKKVRGFLVWKINASSILPQKRKVIGNIRGGGRAIILEVLWRFVAYV